MLRGMEMNRNYDFRILVIDDNPDIHKDFIKILTSSHAPSELDILHKSLFDDEKETNQDSFLPQFKIDTATQGQAGFDKIRTAIQQGEPYSLAFVDIRMPPGWDGVETIKHIWDIDKDIQIVICTAFSDYSWEETISVLGHTDNLLILKKPFDHIAVRQLACALTQKWKLAQEARSYTDFLEKSVKKRTEELQHLATHDALTGLPNRILLNDRLQQAISASERTGSSFAVLFFDLDRFKLVNDSLSHAAGDELLCAVSKRLQSVIRSSDTLARLGGDEFVMIVTDLPKLEYVTSIVTAALKSINQPYRIAGHDIALSSSIGIALYPKDGTNADILLRNADSAMYHAKGAGSNRFQFYSEKMNQESLIRLELENDLREAIINEELFLCYQPEFDLKMKKLIAVEAFVRWRHPTKGIILPINFIPLAEETGLIIPIGDWVLKEACKQNKAWQEEGLPPIRIAVNVTTPQLRELNFVEKVKNILKETKLSPEFLELEVSENSIINNQGSIRAITELKNIGVNFAVDDFGTGYSSLNYLRNIPFDRLKIDKSFIHNIKINRSDEVLIHAIISMAKSLNLEVLAEGVENQNQLSFLKDQKCDEIQGFYFSQPLSESEVELLLKDESNIKKVLVDHK